MFELIRKGMLAGLGAAVVTRDKIKEKTRYLVEEGKLTVEESEKLAKELVDEGEGQWKELREEMQSMVRATLDELDIGSKKEFEDLKGRLTSIEQRLAMIEDRLAGFGTVSGPAPGDPGHA